MYIRPRNAGKARYEAEEQANGEQEGKKTQELLWMVISSRNHKIPTLVYSPFTFVLISKNVFCQGMVVLLNPVCIVLSGMFHVYKSDVSVAVRGPGSGVPGQDTQL